MNSYPKHDCIATKQLEFLHCLDIQRYGAVVVIDGVIDNQPVGSLLPLEDRSAEVLLRFPFGTIYTASTYSHTVDEMMTRVSVLIHARIVK